MILSTIASGAGATVPANVNGASLSDLSTRDNVPPAFTAPRVVYESRHAPIILQAIALRPTDNEHGRRVRRDCNDDSGELARMPKLIPPPCPPDPKKVVPQQAAPVGAGKECVERRLYMTVARELIARDVIVPCDQPPKKRGWCSMG